MMKGHKQMFGELKEAHYYYTCMKIHLQVFDTQLGSKIKVV